MEIRHANSIFDAYVWLPISFLRCVMFLFTVFLCCCVSMSSERTIAKISGHIYDVDYNVFPNRLNGSEIKSRATNTVSWIMNDGDWTSIPSKLYQLCSLRWIWLQSDTNLNEYMRALIVLSKNGRDFSALSFLSKAVFVADTVGPSGCLLTFVKQRSVLHELFTNLFRDFGGAIFIF